MVDKELINILCCPETKEDVSLAANDVIDKVNAKIEAGNLSNRAGTAVSEKIQGGLIREDGAYLYPIREDIPIMLIDEAIPVKELV